MSKPIVIDKIDHKPPIMTVIFDKLLADCYFYPIGDGTFSLISRFELPLATGLKTGQDFSFDLGPFHWDVSEFSIDSEKANGKWVANVQRLLPLKPPGDDEADGEGSFQAQAGGHGVPEEYAAAASSSY
ncbi:MAG TPA: hypothetical protein VJP89_00075 [Pyrinomonadaceae bacterium]|nr:hypothetical protein [Pyrinomonadaceae bacterium]